MTCDNKSCSKYTKDKGTTVTQTNKKLKDGTLSVLPFINTTKLNSFDKFSWLYYVHMCHFYSFSLTSTAGMSV